MGEWNMNPVKMAEQLETQMEERQLASQRARLAECEAALGITSMKGDDAA